MLLCECGVFLSLSSSLSWFILTEKAVMRLTCHHLAGGLLQLVAISLYCVKLPRGLCAWGDAYSLIMYNLQAEDLLWRVLEEDRGWNGEPVYMFMCSNEYVECFPFHACVSCCVREAKWRETQENNYNTKTLQQQMGLPSVVCFVRWRFDLYHTDASVNLMMQAHHLSASFSTHGYD